MNSLKSKYYKFIVPAMMTMMTATSAMANDVKAPNFMSIANPIVALINALAKPLLAIVVAVGGLYCILLGAKFAKAEEPQEREKAKKHLTNAVIGFVLIFILILAMNLGTPILVQWVNDNSSAGISIS